MIEVTLWAAIFVGIGRETLGGFSQESYIAYALWAAFVARCTANWMYEFRMIDEIDTGTVNSVLARPISFYEYYLGQFLGYKILTAVISLLVPIVITMWIPGPTMLSRVPLALVLIFTYFILTHTISFTVASFGFFFNRVHSFTVAKNFTLWIVSGELFPLDLVPDPYREWLMWLPFSNGVFVPVGYITGRLELADVGRGFLTIGLGILFFGLLARFVWLKGRQQYSGTGA